MKLTAFAFALILGFLTVQPVFNFEQKNIVTKSCCSKSVCGKKQTDSQEKNHCNSKGCNPFMSCMYGNFFLQTISNYTLSVQGTIRSKIVSENDNRIISSLSDCWHPPKAWLV